jgi:hypothetical protein
VTLVFAFIVLLIGECVGAKAEPSGTGLTINYDKLPLVAIEAKDVPSIQILNQLADRLHFEVDNPPSAEKSPTITGSFKGDVADLLRRVVLRGMSYITIYRGAAIERIVITSSEGTAAVAAAASSPGDQNSTLSAAAAPAQEIRAAASRSGHAATALPSQNQVARLLQEQAGLMLPVALAGCGKSRSVVLPAQFVAFCTFVTH